MDPRDWFEKRTFHHRDFSDIAELVRLKKEKGHRVSVCLPTLNEAETVGPILRGIRDELIDKHPLVDQLAIIDSRSSDGTVEIARAEGAEVYFDDEIMPEVGVETGKGEALWKSLYVLEGDIIIWVDSDIENFHPRFVYGVAGVLIVHPDVSFVKGFYERPLREGEGLASSGGGRVTELTVRPMLSLFYPDLSFLIQPLSGEYGGRRSLLESVPFFTGYGVETGLILDIYEKEGLEAFAQVDLEVRIHKNQPLESLSKMSFGIFKTLFKRLERDGRLKLLKELPEAYNMVSQAESGYGINSVLVRIVERPPVVTIARYMEKHKT